ncbi:MAG: DUF420 domain-containing protein [Microscillaceae bacterium]|nr:DUF420 domain-containing protein [Microscillaceae bacterium]MDW8461453.1 DUF420 domain-containing protein [Cytophagales bacterium]
MEQNLLAKNSKLYLILVGILSVAIPVVVALLLLVPQTGKLGNLDVSALPTLNAILNSITFCCLIGAFVAIRNKNIRLHKRLMLIAFVLSSIFLVSYVIYHFQAESTKFGDANGNKILEESERLAIGMLRYIYYFVLISHVILAAVVVPFVLLAFYYSLSGQIAQHKRVVKYAFPIWVYVAFTGVVVYLMISPYYK